MVQRQQQPTGSPSLGVLRHSPRSSGALRDDSLVHRRVVSPLVRRQYERSERSSPGAIRASSLMVQRQQNDLQDKPHVQLKVPSPGAIKDGPLRKPRWSAAGSSSQEVGQNRPLDRSIVKPQEVGQNRRPLDRSRVKPQEVGQNRRPLDQSGVKPQEVGQNRHFDRSRVKMRPRLQSKPDSVIQKLLDRFDPIRFAGARTPQEVRS